MAAAVALRTSPGQMTEAARYARDLAVLIDVAAYGYRYSPGYRAIVAAGHRGLEGAARTYDPARGITRVRWANRWILAFVRRAARRAG